MQAHGPIVNQASHLLKKVPPAAALVSTAATVALRARMSYTARKNDVTGARKTFLTDSHTTLRATTLYKFTALNRRLGRRKLQSGGRRSKRLLRASVAVHTRLQKRLARAVQQRAAHSAENLGRRFVDEAPVTSVVSPLTFQRPTGYVVETEGSKRAAFTANVASKEVRYKATAQYVESLTAFIPELVSHIVSKKIKMAQTTSNLTYSVVRCMIRNVY